MVNTGTIGLIDLNFTLYKTDADHTATKHYCKVTMVTESEASTVNVILKATSSVRTKQAPYYYHPLVALVELDVDVTEPSVSFLYVTHTTAHALSLGVGIRDFC